MYPDLILILPLFFIVAFLYSSVGHGGASGYLAIMGLLSISPLIMKSAALIMNVAVSAIAFYQYYRNDHFRWKLFYPFALWSVPMAFLGANVDIDPTWYKRILGLCLIIATIRISGIFNSKEVDHPKELPFIGGILTGAFLGFISGMIGIGGGILLSPIILLFNWGNLKETAGVSALFIFVNSIAGILGSWENIRDLNPEISIWILVALIGGLLGAYWGSNKTSPLVLRRTLAFVLLLASVKLFII